MKKDSDLRIFHFNSSDVAEWAILSGSESEVSVTKPTEQALASFWNFIAGYSVSRY